jgi:hypothetical protein
VGRGGRTAGPSLYSSTECCELLQEDLDVRHNGRGRILLRFLQYVNVLYLSKLRMLGRRLGHLRRQRGREVDNWHCRVSRQGGCDYIVAALTDRPQLNNAELKRRVAMGNGVAVHLGTGQRSR